MQNERLIASHLIKLKNLMIKDVAKDIGSQPTAVSRWCHREAKTLGIDARRRLFDRLGAELTDDGVKFRSPSNDIPIERWFVLDVMDAVRILEVNEEANLKIDCVIHFPEENLFLCFSSFLTQTVVLVHGYIQHLRIFLESVSVVVVHEPSKIDGPWESARHWVSQWVMLNVPNTPLADGDEIVAPLTMSGLAWLNEWVEVIKIADEKKLSAKEVRSILQWYLRLPLERRFDPG